jgi:subtilase family serine protease
VAGIVSLNDFQLRPQSVVHAETVIGQVTPGESDGNGPAVTFGSGAHALGPADYAVIYNMNPAFQGGFNGSGSSIAVVGRTNINVADVNDFRSLFGLPSNPPQIIVNGTDPGNLGGGEELEAVLDVSWSGATAPNATVKFVVSKSTSSSDGIILSEQYIVNNNLADVMTMSFGSCEASYSSGTANALSAIAQQGAAEGITMFVSSGDSGSAGCDSPTSSRATGPLSVNILSSNPYTVAVGGTQFADTTNPSAYWRSTNGSGYGSALSYIPEMVWNESGSNLYASGGGVSTFYARPSWQTGVAGLPSDAFRHVPDVSLTAAGHDGYLVCLHRSCVPNTSGQISFSIVGGTSASSPSFAGIMALVKQKAGARQGQADYTFYRLAAQNPAACNGSSATLPASNCIFNDTTTGSNAVPGVAGYGTPSASYQAGAGYDSATGLGSVNVSNLVNAWTGGSSTPTPRATSTSLTITPTTSTQGASVTVGASVSPSAATGSVTITTSGGTTVATWPLSGGSVNMATSALPLGSYTVTARYSGDSTYAASVSAPVSVTVSSATPTSNLTLSPASLSFGTVAMGTNTTQTIAVMISRATTSGSVPISGISLTGANAGDFSMANNCGTSVTLGVNCTIWVTFQPTASGPRSASVTIQADTTLNVPVSGTGSGSSGSPGVSLSATNLNFNGVNIGTPSAPQGFTITNTGSAGLSISGISITGANTGDFGQSNNCPATLGASASCNVTVTFTPRAAGSRSAAVTITDSAPGSPHSVSLSGSGNSAGAPAASLTTSSLTFASQSVGSTSVGQTVILTSTGSVSLTISSITVTGANAGDFGQTNNCPGALATGSTCSITVTFVPTAASTRTAAVSIADSAGGRSITLTGTGASGTAQGALQLSPSSINFSTNPVGRTSMTQWVQVKNNGANAINIFNVSLGGTNPREFLLSSGCWGALGPGAVCSVGVAFWPQSTGSKSALLQLQNDGPGGTQSVTLTGVGQ